MRLLKRVTLIERLTVTRLAWLLVLVAAVAVALAIAFEFFDAWAPGVTTATLSIALTLGVVQEVVRRAERERLRPRVERAHQQIVRGLHSVAGVVLHDAAFRLPVRDGDELPDDARSALRWWLAGESNWDAERGTLALVLSEVRYLTGVLDGVRDLERDVLEPKLVAEIDKFCEETLALQVRDQAYWSDPQRIRVGAVSGVQAAKRFWQAYEEMGYEVPVQQGEEDLSRWSPEGILAELREAHRSDVTPEADH